MAKKTVLITGASKGIGLALSHTLNQSDYKVVGIARHELPFPGELITLDLSDINKTREVFAQLNQRYTFDAIVNNVGLVKPQYLDEVGVTDLQEVMNLNLIPALLAVQAALPAMRSQQWGRIINISSLTVLGVQQRTAYAAAKAALISFTRSWALELAQSGITVNAIAPGPTETELFRENNPHGSTAEAKYMSMVPMKRFAQPEEIASGIEFLLSDKAGFITGQTLFIDGGASIGKMMI